MPIGISTELRFTDPRLKEMAKSVKMIAADKALSDSDTVYRPKDIDDWTWQVSMYKGIGEMGYVPDGADPDTDSPSPDHVIVRGVIQEGISIEITDFALSKGAKWREVNSQALAESPDRTNETRRQAHYEQSLEGATVGTIRGVKVVDERCYNGNSYFNDGHGFLGVTGITNSNLSSSTRTWSKTGCASMIKQARGWTNYDGHPFQCRPVRFVVGDDLLGIAGVTLKSQLDPDNANNAENVLRYEGGKTGGAPGYDHWAYMGTSDFMLETDCTMPGLDGLCHAFLKGYKRQVAQYHKTNSKQVVVMEVRQRSRVYGDNPYKYITNRAPIT